MNGYDTHAWGEPFLKSSSAVTAWPETALASMTAISISCLTPARYRRTASQTAQTNENEVETKGDVDRVVQSICLATSSYVLTAAIRSTDDDEDLLSS